MAAGPMVPADPTDVLVTQDLEDAFNVEPTCRASRPPPLVISGSNDHCYAQELFQGTARERPGRADTHLPGRGHLRASSFIATTHLILGFVLAGIPIRPGHRPHGDPGDAHQPPPGPTGTPIMRQAESSR
jgi:hypothetical protein